MKDAKLMDDYDYYEPSQEEKTLGTLSHLGALASSCIPMGNIVMPLVIWLLKRDESEFVDDQAKEALNFQITMTILFMGAGILCFILIGIPMIIGLAIFDIVVSIIAAIKASEGRHYDYPINFRFIK